MPPGMESCSVDCPGLARFAVNPRRGVRRAVYRPENLNGTAKSSEDRDLGGVELRHRLRTVVKVGIVPRGFAPRFQALLGSFVS